MSEHPEEVPGRVWMRGYPDREKKKLMAILEEREALYIASQAKMIRLRKEREMKDDELGRERELEQRLTDLIAKLREVAVEMTVDCANGEALRAIARLDQILDEAEQGTK